MTGGSITRRAFAGGALFAFEGGLDKFVENVQEFYYPLRWLLVLAIVLTIADVWW